MTGTMLPIYDGRWSKSSLDTVLYGCSWKWMLRKVAGLPEPSAPALVAGSAYHLALEEHEKIRIVNARRGNANADLLDLETLEGIAHAYVAAEISSIPDETFDRQGTTPGDVVAQVEAGLSNWWHGGLRDRLLTYRPLAVEPYFDVPLGQRGLRGFIDWFGWDPNAEQFVVIDHKTAGSFNHWPEDGTGHEVEATAYHVGAELSKILPVTAGTPRRMEWHIARKKIGERSTFEPARIVTLEVEDQHVGWFDQDLREADAIANREAYVPKSGWNLCSAKWCQFWDGCQGGEGPLGDWAGVLQAVAQQRESALEGEQLPVVTS